MSYVVPHISYLLPPPPPICCNLLQSVAVCCNLLQSAAVCCNVLQCVAMCCNVLQCVAICCALGMGLAQWVCALLCLAVCCSVLKCVAMCCALGAGLHNGCVPSYTRVCTYLCIYVYRHALTICLYSHICIDLFVVYLFIWPWVHVYI